MLRWMWLRLRARYDWLNPLHPIAVRDTRWMHRDLPLMLRRLNNPWSMLGYAAVVHGVLFVISIIAYHYLGNTLAGAFIPLLSPFLTPFGTPLAAALLHSILYWAMLIGICNQMTFAIAREYELESWRVLRLTPFSPVSILLAKVMTVARNWALILRTLTIVRMLSLLILPIAVASQRTRETAYVTTLDLVGVAIFLAQPFAEVLFVLGVATLSGIVIRNTVWAKVYAYGGVALTLGALYGLSSLWLTFTSPIGALAGLLVPLGHWTPLIAAMAPPKAPAIYTLQTALFVVLQLIVPLVLGTGTLYASSRLARREI